MLAIFRRGRAHATNLRDMALDFGDALLLYGPREKLNVLGKENDFIVLTQSAQEAPRLEKAPISSILMAATFVPVILGVIPIYIATVIGAALMVLFKCLTMEEAYRAIEWKAVFLIAGMFPLGTALDQSGAAKFLAEGVVAAVGPYGPTVVMLALLVLTFLATCVIPTAALVLLLAPHHFKCQPTDGNHSLRLHDGHGHGGIRQLYDPHFASGQHSGNGAGRLPIQGLLESGGAVDPGGADHHHGGGAHLLAPCAAARAVEGKVCIMKKCGDASTKEMN